MKTAKPQSSFTLDNLPSRLRIDQVAAYLNASDRHVSELIESGRLPAIDVSSPRSKRRLYRVEKTALAAFVEKAKKTP